MDAYGPDDVDSVTATVEARLGASLLGFERPAPTDQPSPSSPGSHVSRVWPSTSWSTRSLTARAFCRNPLQTESTICPAAYRELYGFERERQLGVLFVNFETHAWGKDPLENATGSELLLSINQRERAHVRQARGPARSRVLKKTRPCTPW